MINSATNVSAAIGTQDFDAYCYKAFVYFANTNALYGPDANCGIYPQVETSPVPRSLGWHHFTIQADTQTVTLSIDGALVYTYAGGLSFDRIQLDMSGPSWRPDMVAYFDDFSYVPTAVGPPTAVAGPNQTIDAGQTVHLDGTGSFAPNTASASLSYAWSFVSRPSNSTTTLSGANTATPGFLADAQGTYVVQLIVTDPDTGLVSAPSQVTVSSIWTPPEANAGVAQSIVVGSLVTLSGSGLDPNGLPLSYAWSFVSKPGGSVATLSGASTPTPSFTPDVAGSYTVGLLVSDAIGSSSPSTVIISVITAADYAQQQIGNAINFVGSMPVSQFQAPGHRQSLTNLLQQAIGAIQAGNTSLANHQLTSAITRTDGYPVRGALDGPGTSMDWVLDPTAQGVLYHELTSALSALRQ